MKSNQRAKIIISVLLTLFLLITATAAWFFTNNDVEVDYGSTIQCEAGNSLEISVDGGETWHSSVQYSSISPRIIDISGNGVNLYKPNIITDEGIPQSFVNATPAATNDKGEMVGDYIEMKVMLRSASVMNVYFSGESSVLPKSTSAEDKNIYGNFSKDFIAGAVRVAVIEEVNGSEELRMIWAPNPKYELYEKNSDGGYGFRENGTPESSYSYYVANNAELTDMGVETVSAEKYVNKQFVVGSTGGDITTSGNSPILTVLDTKLKPEDQVYTKTIIVRIWFEGTDREAHQALSGGWVDMKFKFNGMQKSAPDAAKQAEINEIVYFGGEVKNLKDGMMYTTDGRQWFTYSSSEPVQFTSGATYYFKYPETDTHYETAYKTIIIG